MADLGGPGSTLAEAAGYGFALTAAGIVFVIGAVAALLSLSD